MIIFAHPQYLLLLLLIPFFFLGLGLWMRVRRRRLRKLGDEALVRELMPSWSRSKRWVRAALYSLAFFFFVIGLSRPQIGAKLKEYKAKGAEIMVVLDVSNSMLAQDYSPNRLERAKLAISRITDKLQGDRIGLIIFAGSSFVQLPITSDYISAKMFPDFANYRRDGYDFDARFDDGLASYQDRDLFELLDANAPVLSKQLKKIGGYGKNGRKGFDASLARLQKQCYVITGDFRYAVDKAGERYGWGVAQYTTPERFFGKKFRETVYKRTPEESYERVVKQLRKVLPGASKEQIEKILR